MLQNMLPKNFLMLSSTQLSGYIANNYHFTNFPSKNTMSTDIEPLDLTDDDSVVPADQQENESDIHLTKDGVEKAVMFNTDWTVETLYTQIKKGNINLDPKFQRREAWDEIRQSKLIESIICSFPIPNVVLAEDRSSKGRYIVIDGKQRLFSIQNFLNGDLALIGLETRKDLNGLKFTDFPILAPEEIPAIENQPIRTIIIRNWPSEDYLYSIFYRLNSGSLPLSSQELRKALHGGKLLDYIDDYISMSESFQRIFRAKVDPRMRDVELVLRFVAFDTSLSEYRGNLKEFLDNAVKYFDKDWDAQKPKLDATLIRLTHALDLSFAVFGANAFKKYNGENYERRANRAVFDVITRYFSQAELDPENVITAKDEIESRFQSICKNPAFKDAIERTTKTPNATNTRLKLWGNELAEILGRKFDATTMRVS